MARQVRTPLARRFWRDDRGTIAIVFALTAVPLLAMAGAAIDLSNSVKNRATLQAAVDAASLAAARAYTEDKSADISTIAKLHFDANLRDRSQVDAVTVKATASNEVVRVTADAKVPTTLLKLAGIETIDVGVVAEATAAQTRLIFHFLLDTSPTMTLPSENVYAPVDAAGCFFSCHDDGSLARNAGLVPKMDIIREMMTELVEEIEATAKTKKSDVLYNVVTFNEWATVKVDNVDGPGPVETFLANPLVLGGQGTNLNEPLQLADYRVRNQKDREVGDQHIVVLISDGSHERAPVAYDPGACGKVKATGAALYTVYIRNGEWAYDNPNAKKVAMDWPIIRYGGKDSRGHHSGIRKAEDLMRACATRPDMAYSGEFADEIRKAFEKLINDVTASNLRISS